MELIGTNSKRDSWTISTSREFCVPLTQSVKREVGLPLFQTTENEDLFMLKTIKANFDVVATVDVLIASNSEVKLVETELYILHD